jgi:cytochrome c peroxidase
LLAALLALVVGWDTADERGDRAARALPILPLGIESMLPVPLHNRLAPDKVALGRRLFADPGLSRDGTVSCATCHRPDLGFSDGRARARGIGGRLGRRNTPSLVNCAYRRSLFWDGRAANLEEQALLPIENLDEMGHSVPAVLETLRRDATYRRSIATAFGTPEITAARVARALAAFERTIVAAATPFDHAGLTGAAALATAAPSFRTSGSTTPASAGGSSQRTSAVSRSPVAIPTKAASAPHRCTASRTPHPLCTTEASRASLRSSSSTTAARNPTNTSMG